eukprot:scaffold66569_cov22-Tisochrysis_lutea.AAC.2
MDWTQTRRPPCLRKLVGAADERHEQRKPRHNEVNRLGSNTMSSTTGLWVWPKYQFQVATHGQVQEFVQQNRRVHNLDARKKRLSTVIVNYKCSINSDHCLQKPLRCKSRCTRNLGQKHWKACPSFDGAAWMV